MKIFIAVQVLFLALGIAACGAQDTGTEDPTPSNKDERYHFCVEHGGSFSYQGNDGSFRCDGPEIPSPSESSDF